MSDHQGDSTSTTTAPDVAGDQGAHAQAPDARTTDATTEANASETQVVLSGAARVGSQRTNDRAVTIHLSFSDEFVFYAAVLLGAALVLR